MLDMTMVAVLSVVLSDRFELVSDWTVILPFNPHKVGATQPEQRRGSV